MKNSKRPLDDSFMWLFLCSIAILVAMGTVSVDHVRQNRTIPFFKRALVWLIALTVIGFFGFGVYSAWVAIF